jgi:hypothetical protein
MQGSQDAILPAAVPAAIVISSVIGRSGTFTQARVLRCRPPSIRLQSMMRPGCNQTRVVCWGSRVREER